jgi:hypothetical protein
MSLSSPDEREICMNVIEFEQKIFEIEEVRLVVRAPSGTAIGSYDYQRCAAQGASVTEWLKQRVFPNVTGYDVIVVDGTGSVPHGRTRMSTLRESYEH